MNLEKLTEQSCQVVKEVAAFIKKEVTKIPDTEIVSKGKNNFVTHVDILAEKQLVEGLKKIIPSCGFITEENTPDKEGEYVWIIDPLDGTTNFIHSIPFYCISVALMKDKEVIIGIVHEINSDEQFYSWKGADAFLNNKKITVSISNQLSEALLATGFPYQYFEKLPEYINLLKEVLQQSRGVRRLGSAALDLAYVACGRFDGFFEYNLNAWDVAAGAFLVEQAGGKVTDFKGEGNYIFGKEIVAGSEKVQISLLGLVDKNFKTL